MLHTPFAKYPHLKVMGDAHLGRRFTNDVPIHRRGDREAMVKKAFMQNLLDGVTMKDLVVQSGDIFDTFTVGIDTVLFVWEAIREAQKATGATYVVYRGNHDGSRDVDKKSSFDMLYALFHSHESVLIFKEPAILSHDGGTFGIMPWDAFKSAEELAIQLHGLKDQAGLSMLDGVFTHCDLDSFGENVFNVMPYDILHSYTNKVVNGHIHAPEIRTYKTTEFECVGSMQPYSHGEDPDGEFYVTLTLEEFSKIDHETLKDKNVRIFLEENENLPDSIPDCLSFTAKRGKAKVRPEEEDDSEVRIEDFSMEKIIKNALANAGVGEAVGAKLLDKYNEAKNTAV